MATQVILLERVESLGNMGDVVAVKPGYARNYLLPQKKALRASKENVAYFEAKKKFFEAENEKGKENAQKLAKKIDGIKVVLVRQASESGQLYGSVNARDIAVGVSEEAKVEINRSMVQINQNYKTVGLFPIDIALHPEVKVSITINVARTVEEADIQAKTGKALIIDESQSGRAKAAPAEPEANLEDVLEEGALEANKERTEQEQLDAAEDEAKSKAKQEKRKAKPKKEKAEKSEDSEEAEPVEIG